MRNNIAYSPGQSLAAPSRRFHGEYSCRAVGTRHGIDASLQLHQGRCCLPPQRYCPAHLPPLFLLAVCAATAVLAALLVWRAARRLAALLRARWLCGNWGFYRPNPCTRLVAPEVGRRFAPPGGPKPPSYRPHNSSLFMPVRLKGNFPIDFRAPVSSPIPIPLLFSKLSAPA